MLTNLYETRHDKEQMQQFLSAYHDNYHDC